MRWSRLVTGCSFAGAICPLLPARRRIVSYGLVFYRAMIEATPPSLNFITGSRGPGHEIRLACASLAAPCLEYPAYLHLEVNSPT